MLENAWAIPAVTFASFWLILFFGKRLPKHGAEIGVGALGVALALSLVTAYEWIQRDATVEVHHEAGEGESEEAAPAAGLGAPGRTASGVVVLGRAAEGGEEVEGGEAELKREPVRNVVTWFENGGGEEEGGVSIEVGVLVDGLSVALLVVVSVISFLVHVYSTSYMHDDRRYTYFFAALSLFTTGMFVLVTSASTLQMIFGWELMGVCSFMLIGHWWEEKANSDAALKAFFTTRTGDVGLLVGVSILFFGAGQTFDILELNEAALAGDIGEGVLLAGAVALFVAVIGKSAQFPLHTWLPDAMAGPTPVSALIHAATMVVAGVFLLARLYPVFWEAFSIGDGGVNPVALIGGITILIAAALAFVQSDIKKVLAYSTVSQLGYMVMALGVGAWTAGVFHLFTHAFFKGLLFLGAGSVGHAVHSFDMKKDMGGLRRSMPTTFATFTIGTLALAGVPPLAGFWSKDEILLGAGENGYEVFEIVGLVGALMTAAYMTRCLYLTFFGQYRGHGHPHESPPAITIPLVVLAVLSVVAGFLNATAFDVELFQDWVEPAVVSGFVEHHAFNVGDAAISVAMGGLGIGLAWAYYWRNLGPHRLTQKSGLARAGYRFLDNRYYLDHLYTGGVVRAIKSPISRAAYWFNQNVLDGVVNGVAYLVRGLARFVYRFVDQGLIDGAVNGSGALSGGFGGALRTLQTGRVQQYAALLFGAAGVAALALVLFQ